ncbi:hypothetical protein ABZ635_22075 [Nocardiopsis sp. NPDC007018]|uniref:hypothetical protein n=1 Tax=Nocardiopsis sp. NPDC007018 TaxID=3155721 RepID=UPI00340B6D4D
MSRWTATGHEVVVGEHEGPWCKARAVADGLSRASGNILVVADADVWSPGWGDAVDLVQAGVPWAMPHGPVRRLTHAATQEVLDGHDPHADMDLTQRPYEGWPGGGLVALTRDAYEVAPLDPRFVGWSGEDESWAHALRALAGEGWRGNAPLWHLWHPPQERMSRRWGSTAARALASRYARARTPGRMRALVDEALSAA